MRMGRSRSLRVERTWRQTSVPDRSGNIQSSTTRLGRAADSLSIAWRPSRTVSTSKPASVRGRRTQLEQIGLVIDDQDAI